jgi:hypothetical protein
MVVNLLRTRLVCLRSITSDLCKNPSLPLPELFEIFLASHVPLFPCVPASSWTIRARARLAIGVRQKGGRPLFSQCVYERLQIVPTGLHPLGDECRRSARDVMYPFDCCGSRSVAANADVPYRLVT